MAININPTNKPYDDNDLVLDAGTGNIHARKASKNASDPGCLKIWQKSHVDNFIPEVSPLGTNDGSLDDGVTGR